MKKILVAFVVAVALTGCNKQIVDFTYNFDSAIIELPKKSRLMKECYFNLPCQK